MSQPDAPIQKHGFATPFNAFIVGPAASGKTLLMVDLIKGMEQPWTNIEMYAPCLETVFRVMKDATLCRRFLGIDSTVVVHENYDTFSEDSEAWLEAKGSPPRLIVIDSYDCLQKDIKRRIVNLVIRCRPSNISVIVVGQHLALAGVDRVLAKSFNLIFSLLRQSQDLLRLIRFYTDDDLYKKHKAKLLRCATGAQPCFTIVTNESNPNVAYRRGFDACFQIQEE